MKVHDDNIVQVSQQAPASDRATSTALLAFAAASVAAVGLFFAFPALWDNLLAANQIIYESRVVSAILCRP